VRVAELAGVLLVPVALIVVVGTFAGDSALMNLGAVWAGYVLAVLLVWAGLRSRGQGWDHFGLRVGRVTWRRAVAVVLQSFAVFVAALVAFVLGSVVASSMVGPLQAVDATSYDYMRGRPGMLLLSLASSYLVSATGEELIFRGFLMNRLAELWADRRAAWLAALAVNTIAFGLIHYAWGTTGMIQTGCMGLVLGVSYLAVQRNLWVVILAHAYMDTLLLLSVYYGA
jgi:membrane protease YdiL (CAAX protease family)